MADSWMTFLAMGGYAPFVWGAYGAAALVLIGMPLLTGIVLHRRARRVQQLEDQRARQPKRRSTAVAESQEASPPASAPAGAPAGAPGGRETRS
jgi:heme exporter protein D